MVEIRENVPLAPMTTLKVGGPARYFVEARSEDCVIDAFRFADENRIAVFVLGGGSNVVISDLGFEGLVLQPRLRGIEFLSDRRVNAGAGEDWDEFVGKMVADGLAGLECLSGIPGFVGGTPVQNVGAYGQEVSETIESVRCFDREKHCIVELTNADCKFSYRRSIFNTNVRERYVVLSVTFALIRDGEPKVAYKDLMEHFDGRKPTLRDVRKAVIDIRRAKSMVIDSNDPNSKSAGSFFKNPIVSRNKFKEISVQQDVPSFPGGEGFVKVPAAWLIEKTGFHKGFSMGNAAISTNHTLAIINRGQASAAEIVALMKTIQAGVKEKFGIELRPEPVFVGFDANLH
jgi:UDP-N-acetylmuramate dehydrogenase